MHSRIIELSKNIVEIDNRITEDDYSDNGFVGNIGDYVAPCNRKDAIDWLASYLENKDVITEHDEVKIVFSSNVDEKYFGGKYDEFKKLSEELSFREFVDSMGIERYRIQNCLDDKYGFYIHCGGCYYTLDDFIRTYVNDGDTWYIGGTLDYHC